MSYFILKTFYMVIFSFFRFAQQISINPWFWRDDTLGNPNVSCYLWCVTLDAWCTYSVYLTEYRNFHIKNLVYGSLTEYNNYNNIFFLFLSLSHSLSKSINLWTFSSLLILKYLKSINVLVTTIVSLLTEPQPDYMVRKINKTLDYYK